MIIFLYFRGMKPALNKSFVFLIFFMACGILYLQMSPSGTVKSIYFHQGSVRGNGVDSLYEGENDVFASAGKCDHCHGRDPEGVANVDVMGHDVNVVEDWSSTMMALSARDPYWRAKVSHEISVNPQHGQELENLCTKCHAPLGNFASQMTGGDHYSIGQMVEDPVALDGVSCLACHRQLPQPEVALHTGALSFDAMKMAYGPYESPLITPMALNSGYTPEHSMHINDSKLCAGCHSLVTQTVDMEGTLTGTEFIEQATWHEWLNSAYPQEGISCQSCHIPRLPKQAVHIANGFNTPAREPYGLHELVGGNVLMLRLMKDNRDALGIAATPESFDETIAKTIDMLQNRTLQLQVEQEYRDEDTLAFSVKLRNLGGHKLPSGYPSRRMTVHVTVKNAENEIVFQSGGFTDDFSVIGENDTWEPHYQYIRDEDEVQIYEMVMGDVNGDRTTILERGAVQLKDNRLVPRGFSPEHPQYDTTQVILGTEDADFGWLPGPDSGTDKIHYRVGMNGETSALSVEVSVYYQSVPPNWVNGMFAHDTAPINAFEEMFGNADKSPVLMRSSQLEVDEFVGVEEKEREVAAWQWRNDISVLKLTARQKGELRVMDYNGRMVFRESMGKGSRMMELKLPASTYIAVFTGENGERSVYRFLALR